MTATDHLDGCGGRTATMPRLVNTLKVLPPPTPDGQVITDYLVEVTTGSYPTSWPFGDDELDDAVERWLDEGTERCRLSACCVQPDDGTEYPRTFRADYSRHRGWTKWEEINS